ncbi:hypothetical protein ACWGJ9_11125 [Curtobacterium citreum]
MTFSHLPGRIVPVDYGPGFTFTCRLCPPLASAFDVVPKKPHAWGERRAVKQFLIHLEEDHPADAPTPDGCAYCGEEQRTHAMSHVTGYGAHRYVAPTSQVRLRRMRARRQAASPSNPAA